MGPPRAGVVTMASGQTRAVVVFLLPLSIEAGFRQGVRNIINSFFLAFVSV